MSSPDTLIIPGVLSPYIGQQASWQACLDAILPHYLFKNRTPIQHYGINLPPLSADQACFYPCYILTLQLDAQQAWVQSYHPGAPNLWALAQEVAQDFNVRMQLHTPKHPHQPYAYIAAPFLADVHGLHPYTFLHQSLFDVAYDEHAPENPAQKTWRALQNAIQMAWFAHAQSSQPGFGGLFMQNFDAQQGRQNMLSPWVQTRQGSAIPENAVLLGDLQDLMMHHGQSLATLASNISMHAQIQDCLHNILKKWQTLPSKKRPALLLSGSTQALHLQPKAWWQKQISKQQWQEIFYLSY